MRCPEVELLGSLAWAAGFGMGTGRAIDILVGIRRNQGAREFASTQRTMAMIAAQRGAARQAEGSAASIDADERRGPG
jgi:hypothetical protein